MTREEVNKRIADFENDLWKLLRKHGISDVPEAHVSEFAVLVLLKIKPDWET